MQKLNKAVKLVYQLLTIYMVIYIESPVVFDQRYKINSLN